MADYKLKAAPMASLPRAVEISLVGEVNSNNVARFQEEVALILKPGVVIPAFLLKDAGFICSAGYAFLMELAESLKRHGGILIMVEPPPKIRVIMESMGIATLFPIVPDGASARATAGQQVERLQKAAKLVEVLGTQEGAEYPILDENITIGSDPKSTIVLKQHQIERHHAEVFRTGEQCFVKDLGSRFGTYVGKKKVTEAPLLPGDIITVATFRYAFQPPGGRAPVAATPSRLH